MLFDLLTKRKFYWIFRCCVWFILYIHLYYLFFHTRNALFCKENPSSVLPHRYWQTTKPDLHL